MEHGAANVEVSTHYVFKILANHKIFTFHIPYSLKIFWGLKFFIVSWLQHFCDKYLADCKNIVMQDKNFQAQSCQGYS